MFLRMIPRFGRDKNGGNLLAAALIANHCGVSAKSTELVSLISATARFGPNDWQFES